VSKYIHRLLHAREWGVLVCMTAVTGWGWGQKVR